MVGGRVISWCYGEGCVEGLSWRDEALFDLGITPAVRDFQGSSWGVSDYSRECSGG